MGKMKTIQLLTFTLNNEIYALDVTTTREVLELSAITPIPRTPPFIRGVINLRGNVVPVLDLKLKLGMGRTDKGRDSCILVLELSLDGEPAVVGVLADSVREVLEIDLTEIEPPPKLGAKISTEYLRGMGRRSDKLFLVLDVAKIFSAAELAAAHESIRVEGELLAPEAVSPMTEVAAPAEASSVAQA